MTNAKPKTPAPPKHLGPEGRALWRGVLADFELVDSHDLARLQVAAEAADRVAVCREEVERTGMFIDGRFGVKASPAALMADRSQATLLKALREIGLDLSTDPAGPRLPSRWRGR